MDLKSCFYLRITLLTLFSFSLFTKSVHAQFINLGPKATSTYNVAQQGANNSSGFGQVHFFGFPPFYTDATKPNSYHTVYSGSPYSGLWKSTDEGQTWNSVVAVENLPVNSVNEIAFSNEVNYTIYIATGATNTGWGGLAPIYSSGIYKSTDFGQTFQPVIGFNTGKNFNNNSLKCVTKIAVNPNNPLNIFVASSDGLYRTIDGGSNWVLVQTDGENVARNMKGIFSVTFSPTNSNIVYCSGRHIFKSTDGGVTFSQVTNNLIPNTRIHPNSTLYSVNNWVFEPNQLFTFSSIENINIRVYNDGGTDKLIASYCELYNYSCCTGYAPINFSKKFNDIYTLKSGIWSFLTPNSDYFSYAQATEDRLKFDALANNLNKIITGVTETHITSDGGLNWGIATNYSGNAHADIHAVDFIPGTDCVLIGTDGGVFKYCISTGSATPQSIGLSNSLVWQMSSAYKKKGHLAVGLQDDNFQWFDGINWHMGKGGGDGYPPVVWDRVNGDNFFVDMNNVLYKHDISTNTWVQVTSGCLNDIASTLQQNPNPYRKDEFYAPFGKGILVSNDVNHATNFRLLENITQDPWESKLRGMFISENDYDNIYAWRWCFDPGLHSGPNVFKFSKTGYQTYNQTDCNVPSTPTVGITEIQTLPANLYTSTVTCIYQNTTPQNVSAIANFFPIGGVALSNTDKNKMWVCFDYKREMFVALPANQYKHRVRKGTYNGSLWSFVNDDLGLPEEPMENILYAPGTNDLVFVSTVTGRVFYKNANMSSWTELDLNLPRTPITCMEVNVCTNKLLIGTFGRGVWAYDMTNLISNSNNDLIINSTVIWANENKSITGNIVIKPGGKLTISGSNINMGRGTKITIEKGTSTLSGGQLVVEGGSYLSNSCGEIWKGIEVLGDPTLAQLVNSTMISSSVSPLKQGVCQIFSSTLENMESGILLGKFGWSDAMYGNAYSGGQLYASQSTFNNNIVAISAYSYVNPFVSTGYIQSRAERCTFKNTSKTNFAQHIYLFNVKGFQIFGCNFDNLLPTSASYNSLSRGAGVAGWNATAEIINFRDQNTAASPNYVKNKFRNLTYGVYFTNNTVVGDATRNLKISECSFKGNTYAIYLNGVKYAAVVNDSIEVPILSPTLMGTPPLQYNTATKSYGIYLNGCSDYKVQNDTIKSFAQTASGSTTGISYGIVVNNGSTLPTMIRRNQIVQNNYGLTAVGNNGSSASGLLFQCNTLKNNTKYDIWLAENTVNGTTTVGSIRNQGSTSDVSFASDNFFYQLSNSYPQYQLMRNAQTNTYTYYYDQNNPLKIPNRVSSTNQIFLQQNALVSSCSEQVVLDDYNPVLTLKIPVTITAIRTKLQEDEKYYTAKLDAASNQNLAEWMDSLIAQPFISKSLTKKVIQHPDVQVHLPKLLELLTQHSGWDDSTAYYLSTVKLPFTRAIVSALQKQLIRKVCSQSQAIDSANTLEAMLDGMIRAEVDKLIDSNQTTSAIQLAKQNYNCPTLHYLWAELAMQYGSVEEQSEAIQKLLSYPSSSVYHHLGEYYTLQSNLASKPSRNSLPLVALYTLYQHGDAVSAKAASLLGALSDTLLAPYLPNPEDEIASMQTTNYWNDIATNNTIYLLASPSPADNLFTVFYQMPEAKTVQIEAVDMQGKVIYSLDSYSPEGKLDLNSSEWESGNYMIRISSTESSETKSIKISIIH